MKKTYLALLIPFLFACKKDKNIVQTSSTINVVNAVIGEANIKVNPSGRNISFNKITDLVAFGTGRFYYSSLSLGSLVAVSALDTTKTLFERTINFEPGIYTLYLSGQAPAIDTLFRKETNYPMIRTDIAKPPSADSVVNVRFVNLSPNSPALNVNIKNNTNNEIENFSYKGIGSWKAYPSKLTSTVYSFEVRNAQSNAILLTYNFTANATNRFRNVALVIRGMVGGTGTNALAISPINYF